MVGQHLVAEHKVSVSLLMRPLQQVVYLCIGGCSHRHARSSEVVSLGTTRPLALNDGARVSTISFLGNSVACGHSKALMHATRVSGFPVPTPRVNVVMPQSSSTSRTANACEGFRQWHLIRW